MVCEYMWQAGRGPRSTRNPRELRTIDDRAADARLAAEAIHKQFGNGHVGPHPRGSRRRKTAMKLKHLIWYLDHYCRHRAESTIRNKRLALMELARALGRPEWVTFLDRRCISKASERDSDAADRTKPTQAHRHP